MRCRPNYYTIPDRAIKQKMNLASSNFEMKQIVADRQVAGRRSYLVRWNNFTSDDDTWVFENEIHDQSLIDKYFQEKEEAKSNEKNSKKESKVSRELISSLNKKKMKKVVSVAKKANKLYYRVMFRDRKLSYISSELMKQFAPELVFDFLIANFQVLNLSVSRQKK